MEGVQKWELRERDIRLLYFVVGSSILLEFFSKACTIEETEAVTITGGWFKNDEKSYNSRMRRVTRYQEDGSSQPLPHLNHGRYDHACGHYTRSDGFIVCFVL